MTPRKRRDGLFFVTKYSRGLSSHLGFNPDITNPKEFSLSVTGSREGFCLMKIHWKLRENCWDGSSTENMGTHGVTRVCPTDCSLGLCHTDGPAEDRERIVTCMAISVGRAVKLHTAVTGWGLWRGQRPAQQVHMGRVVTLCSAVTEWGLWRGQ